MLTACGARESDKNVSGQTADESAAPVARIENIADIHWGVEVDDPYRYM